MNARNAATLEHEAQPDAERQAAQIAAELSQAGELQPLAADYEQDLLTPPAELTNQEGAFISVDRIERDTKRRVYCCRYLPGEFSLERLRQDKGGGHYWVRLYLKAPGAARPAIRWQAYPEIEGPPKPDSQPVSTAIAAGGTAIAAGGTDAVALLRGFEAISSGMMAGFTALFERLAHAQTAQPAQPAQTRLQLLEELQAMRDVFAPTQSAPPVEQALSMFREGLTLAQSLVPPDPDASPATVLMTAAEKILPMIGEVLRQSGAQGAPAAPPRARAAPSAVVAPALPGAPPAPPKPAENDMSLRLQIGIRFLADAAKDDRDPVTYADLVLDNVPEDELRQLLARPDWFEFLVGQVPGCASYRAWFEEVREVIHTTWAELTPPAQGVSVGSAGNQGAGDAS